MKHLLKEEVLIVDVLNNPLGWVARNRIMEEKLFFRQTAAIVTKNDKIYVHQRPLDKHPFPGHWDMTMGGLINKGETDEHAAGRELQEELGIRNTPLSHICTMSVSDQGWFYWVVFYHGVWNSDINPCKSEVEQVKLLSLSEIKEMVQNDNPFTPLSLRFLKHREKKLHKILNYL